MILFLVYKKYITKNQLLFLRTIISSLTSLINQAYRNIEIIIVDDDSTDNTIDLIKNIDLTHIETHIIKIRIFKTSVNIGTYACKDYGITKSSGEYITFVDSDDTITPHHIYFLVNSLIKNSNLVMVYSKTFRRNKNKKWIRSNGFAHVTSMVNKNIISKYGYFDPVRFGSDREFRERITKIFGLKSIGIGQNTYFYNEHDTSLSNSVITGNKSRVRQKYRQNLYKWLMDNTEDKLYMPFPQKIEHRKIKIDEDLILSEARMEYFSYEGLITNNENIIDNNIEDYIIKPQKINDDHLQKINDDERGIIRIPVKRHTQPINQLIKKTGNKIIKVTKIPKKPKHNRNVKNGTN